MPAPRPVDLTAQHTELRIDPPGLVRFWDILATLKAQADAIDANTPALQETRLQEVKRAA